MLSAVKTGLPFFFQAVTSPLDANTQVERDVRFEGESLGKRLGVAFASGVAVFAIIRCAMALGDARLMPPLMQLREETATEVCILCVACAFLPPLIGTKARRWLQVGLSLVGVALLTDWLELAMAVGFTTLVAVTVRRFRSVRLQLVLILAAWILLPASRWFHLAAINFADIGFVAFWASLAYSCVWLVIQRARGARPTVADDLFYLLALPRLVMPFFAPISQHTLLDSERAPRQRVLLSGLALAAYGLALLVLDQWIQDLRPADPNAAGSVAAAYFRFYSRAASHLFLAMALFRMFGFGVPSGFRWPFLSRSFREFFRTWNHYVRDAVYELFLLPCVGWLRAWLPSYRAIRVVSTYLAILFGSYVMNDMLIPLATSADLANTLRTVTRWQHLLFLVVFWSAIIWPGELFRRRRAYTRWGSVLAVLRFNLVFFSMWYGLRWATVAS